MFCCTYTLNTNSQIKTDLALLATLHTAWVVVIQQSPHKSASHLLLQLPFLIQMLFAWAQPAEAELIQINALWDFFSKRSSGSQRTCMSTSILLECLLKILHLKTCHRKEALAFTWTKQTHCAWIVQLRNGLKEAWVYFSVKEWH